MIYHVNSGGLSRMISDAFLNKMFHINILILIAFTKQMLNLMYLYILIWKRHVATNDNQICQIACISPINLLIMHIFFSG